MRSFRSRSRRVYYLWCKNSNQYTVVDSFVDIGAGLVLSMWFVLAIAIVFNIGNNRFIIARLTMQCMTNCLCVSSTCCEGSVTGDFSVRDLKTNGFRT